MPKANPRHERPRDADASRTAILNAAETIFAQHGFHGARVDAIATQAGYNKSLIFQYFGDKLRLYAEVLKRADQDANELRARVLAPLQENPALASDGPALKAFLTQAFGALFDYLVAHPQMRRIRLWEMAQGWQTYTQLVPHPHIEAPSQLDLLFQQATQRGLLRSPFSPFIQLSTALQLFESYLATLPLYQMMSPAQDLSTPQALAQARDYIVGLVVAGMVVDTPPPLAESHL